MDHLRRQRGSRRGQADALARGLGWFSIGLGLVEVLAPRTLARTLGMEGSERVLQAYGLREIGTGIGILGAGDPTPWIWVRIAGDTLDLGTLATGLGEDNPRRGNLGLALAAVAGVTVLDVICAQALGATEARRRAPARDYSGRSGLPRPPEAMRGAARDLRVPRDMRVPEAMRPYTAGA